MLIDVEGRQGDYKQYIKGVDAKQIAKSDTSVHYVRNIAVYGTDPEVIARKYRKSGVKTSNSGEGSELIIEIPYL